MPDGPATPSPCKPADQGLRRQDLRVILVCAIGLAFDLGEIVLGTALPAVFAAAPHAASPASISWLLASVYLGAIIGAPLLGTAADRIGRRLVLAGVMLWLAVTSLAGAFSPGIASLSVARGLAGVSLGAFPPLMIAYLTDVLPARWRGPGIMATVAVSYAGPPGIIFLLRWLSSAAPLGWEGWRWTLVAGALGASVTTVLFLGLPESARWRAVAARPKGETARLPRGRFALLAALSFLSPWATVAFPLLTGAVLTQRGFRLSDTLLYVGVSSFGPIVGTALAAFGADRLERRSALVLCAAGMIATSSVFWLSGTPGWLMASSLGFNLCVALYLPAISVYIAELAPTALRARITSRTWAINRVAAALGPLALLPLLYEGRMAALFGVVTASMLASILLVAVFGPRGEAGRRVA
jgi:putative MFS transporter